MRAAIAGAVIAGAVLFACSSESLPPDLTCDAGCRLQIGIETIGSGVDAGTEACTAGPGDSQCLQCAKMGCCTDLDLCSASVACTNLSACEASCVDSTCVAQCQQQFPGGVSPLDELDSCVATACPVCTDLGVGDPCGAAEGSCVTGLTCNELWCTKGCTGSADCAGLGSSGTNGVGEANACVGTATSGDVCFPGCSLSAGDCDRFPGTACSSVTSVDGTTVSICESVSDAAAD